MRPIDKQHLLDLQPSEVWKLPPGWYLQFGNAVIGNRFEVIILQPETALYIDYDVIARDDGLTTCRVMHERALTEDERVHFEMLAERWKT